MDKEDTASVSEDEDMEEQQFRRDTPGPMPEHQYSRVNFSPFWVFHLDGRININLVVRYFLVHL